MKKVLKNISITAAAVILSTSLIYADSSNISYQGVAFNSGAAVASSNISLRFTIYQSDGSTVVYQETQSSVATTDKGFFSHQIGSGTRTAGAANIDAITWADDYKLKVEVDYANGTSYTDLGTQNLSSNIYAKKANSADSATTLTGLTSTVGELNHVDGVTSNIQTQLNGKLSTIGTATTATKLATSRKINGIDFDGSANIGIEPYVEREDTSTSNKILTFVDSDTSSYQRLNMAAQLYYKPSTSTLYTNLSGNASTATKLQTARTIGGVSFNGTQNIDLPGVNTTGTQNTSGTAGTANNVKVVHEQNHVGDRYITLVDGASNSTALYDDFDLRYNPSTNTLTVANVTGNASTATKLATARTIGGVSFDGSADIDLPGVNTAGTQNTSGNAATATKATSIYITNDDTVNIRYLTFANSYSTKYSDLMADQGIFYKPSENRLYLDYISLGNQLSLSGSNNNKIYLRNTNTTDYWNLNIEGSNNLTLYNQSNVGVYLQNGWSSWQSNSDERLKTNIKDLPTSKGLEAILKLRPVNYNWKDKEQNKVAGQQTGLIAQEVQSIFPEFVSTSGDKIITLEDGSQKKISESLGVGYTELIVPLIKAIQEQQVQIENQQNEIDNLKNEISQIKALLKNIK